VRVALLAHLHHAIAEPFAGGMEAHTSMVADELVRRGHDVTLFAKDHSVTLARLEPILGDDFDYGKATDADTRDRVLDDAVTRALNRIEDGGYDVVFNNSLSPLPYTELAAWPMLTVLHTPPTLERVNAVIEDPYWKPGPRHAFVGVSQLNTASWRTKLPQVQHIPNGIFLHRWAERHRPQADVAVWSARIIPEKGLHLAIDAARQARMRLEFSGPIADRAYYEREITPRMGPDVTYRGHLNHHELETLLARAAVFLSTPLWAEPFGLALVEAMACGTPVAAFPNGAAHEVVTAAGGILAARADAPALAEAILVARTKDRGRVRQSAERYDSTTMMDRYETVMDHLVQLPGSRPIPRTLTAGGQAA
jgi:glycosyltransferase involved in cell wall biosynthesis